MGPIGPHTVQTQEKANQNKISDFKILYSGQYGFFICSYISSLSLYSNEFKLKTCIGISIVNEGKRHNMTVPIAEIS